MRVNHGFLWTFCALALSTAIVSALGWLFWLLWSIQLINPAVAVFTPERRAYNELTRRITAANDHLKELVVRDSVARVTPAQASLFVKVLWALPAEQLKRVNEAASQELGARAPLVPIGVVIAPTDLGSHPALVQAKAFSTGERLVIRSDPASCAHVLWSPRNKTPFGIVMDWPIRDHRLLGPCRFWARYGEPGPRVFQWLASSSFRFTQNADFATRFATSPSNVYSGNYSPLDEGCRAGMRDACSKDLMYQMPDSARTPGVYRVAGVFYPSRGVFSTPVGLGLSSMLTQAETDFGPERFGKFWRSSRSVSLAFEEAFGERIDDYASHLLRRRYGSRSAGPAMNLVTVMQSALTIVLLILVTVFVENRRVVS
jgi:hypothetical protein